MADPVDTDALRETARKAGTAIAAVALNGGRIQMRVPADPDSDTDLLVTALECDTLAAADELDSLRKSNAILQAAIQDIELRYEARGAVIAAAPHAEECSWGLYRPDPSVSAVCTCWKADAL